MKRRGFITFLGGAAAWPIAAQAQQGKLPRVGYLSDEPPEPSWFHSRDYILARLDELGYGDGRNIIIEYRYADGQAEKLASMAAELVGIPVDLIVAIGTPASRAALAATRTIPIDDGPYRRSGRVRACCVAGATRRQRHGGLRFHGGASPKAA